MFAFWCAFVLTLGRPVLVRGLSAFNAILSKFDQSRFRLRLFCGLRKYTTTPSRVLTLVLPRATPNLLATAHPVPGLNYLNVPGFITNAELISLRIANGDITEIDQFSKFVSISESLSKVFSAKAYLTNIKITHTMIRMARRRETS